MLWPWRNLSSSKLQVVAVAQPHADEVASGGRGATIGFEVVRGARHAACVVAAVKAWPALPGSGKALVHRCLEGEICAGHRLATVRSDSLMFVYDFDHPQEWVWRFADLIAPLAGDILRETEEKTEWELAGSHIRISVPKPEDPATKRALEAVTRDFASSAFRAFHATRLVSADTILSEGLLALDREKQIARTRAALARSRSARMRERVEAWGRWSRDDEALRSERREGDCWLTPSRRRLHDGGLNLMFGRLGGEFMERISDDPFLEAEASGSEVGQPMVVVAAIPTSWCRWTPEMGPRRLLFEVMRHLGHQLDDAYIPFWDVQIAHDIPPGFIEHVCPRADARVAAPPANP